jgi:hypothetical protein
VVSAASGAVGSVVGQIAKIKGARAVGIAGGPDKCKYVKERARLRRLHRSSAPDLAEKLKAACPKGIDVYFENVSGAVWDAVFPLLNTFARIPVCGLIAQYSATEVPEMKYKTSQIFRAVLTKRLTIRGFIVTDFAAKFPISFAMCRNGSRKAASSIARISPRAWRTPRRLSSGCSRGRTSASSSCASRSDPMTIQMVLLPVFVQVALTFGLLFWMAYARTSSVSRGETKIRDIALGQSVWPARAQQISNNYDSQFALPLLFYVLVISPGSPSMPI